jgi:hypothetical protein
MAIENLSVNDISSISARFPSSGYGLQECAIGEENRTLNLTEYQQK